MCGCGWVREEQKRDDEARMCGGARAGDAGCMPTRAVMDAEGREGAW
jgi:hypothetical protein